MDTYKEENPIPVRTNGCIYRYKKVIIFYTVTSKGIYAWNYDTNECFEIGYISEKADTWLYVALICIGEILYFIPYSAKNMIAYYLESGKTETISIREKCEKARYHNVVSYKDKLYMFPELGNEILIYDVKQKESISRCIEVTDGQNEEIFFNKIYLHDHRVWILTGKDFNIYYYDIAHDIGSFYALEGDYGSFIDITGGNEKLYLLTDRGTIVSWDIFTEKKEIILESKSWTEPPYFAICYYADQLWLFPKGDNYIRVIDLKGKEVRKWDFSHLRGPKGRLFEAVVQQENNIFVNFYHNNKIVIVDTQKYQIEIKEIQFSLIDKLKILINNSKADLEKKQQLVGKQIWKEINKF